MSLPGHRGLVRDEGKISSSCVVYLSSVEPGSGTFLSPELVAVYEVDYIGETDVSEGLAIGKSDGGTVRRDPGYCVSAAVYRIYQDPWVRLCSVP